MLIAKGQKIEYEQVELDVFITGEILEVQGRFGVEKSYKDRETGEMITRKTDQCRFKFELEGYKFPHYSRWNNLSTNENSHLFKTYILPLFGNKYPPNTDIDIEKLAGAKVKVRWDETTLKTGSKFQFVDKIRFLGPADADKIDLLAAEEEPPTPEEGGEVEPNRGNEPPF